MCTKMYTWIIVYMVIVFCRKKVCFRSLYTDSEVLSSFEWGGKKTDRVGGTDRENKERMCVRVRERDRRNHEHQRLVCQKATLTEALETLPALLGMHPFRLGGSKSRTRSLYRNNTYLREHAIFVCVDGGEECFHLDLVACCCRENDCHSSSRHFACWRHRRQFAVPPSCSNNTALLSPVQPCGNQSRPGIIVGCDSGCLGIETIGFLVSEFPPRDVWIMINNCMNLEKIAAGRRRRKFSVDASLGFSPVIG